MDLLLGTRPPAMTGKESVGAWALCGEQSILLRGGEGEGTHTLEQGVLSAKVMWLRQVDAAGRCKAIAPFLIFKDLFFSKF